MDYFKRACVDTATALNYNAPKVVHLKNRGKAGKMLRRMARRRLKRAIVVDEDIICVACGDIIPEGSMVCRKCLLEAGDE